MSIDGNRELGFRRLFSQPRMVRDLCRGFLREEWIGWLDLDTLERAATVPGPPLDRLDEVLIWRLRWQGGSAWVYLLIKLQAEEDPFMALRMGLYRELLYQNLLRRQRGSTRLPVALPVVLYTGRAPWQAAGEALELFLPLLPALQRHAPRTRYLLLDAAHDPIPEAAGTDNLVSLLCRLERSRTPEAVDALLERLVALVSGSGEEGLRQAWNDFLGRSFLPRRFADLFTPEKMEAWGAGGVLA
jgi:Putative transposase, YhgA-like